MKVQTAMQQNKESYLHPICCDGWFNVVVIVFVVVVFMRVVCC